MVYSKYWTFLSTEYINAFNSIKITEFPPVDSTSFLPFIDCIYAHFPIKNIPNISSDLLNEVLNKILVLENSSLLKYIRILFYQNNHLLLQIFPSDSYLNLLKFITEKTLHYSPHYIYTIGYTLSLLNWDKRLLIQVNQYFNE